jgi:hypothetical protein
MALGLPMAEQLGRMMEGAVERKPSGGSRMGLWLHILATHDTRYIIREDP